MLRLFRRDGGKARYPRSNLSWRCSPNDNSNLCRRIALFARTWRFPASLGCGSPIYLGNLTCCASHACRKSPTPEFGYPPPPAIVIASHWRWNGTIPSRSLPRRCREPRPVRSPAASRAKAPVTCRSSALDATTHLVGLGIAQANRGLMRLHSLQL